MKHVVKRNSPEGFEQWKSQVSENWQPSYSSLRDPEKAELHHALLVEQGWVCCYCGRRITQRDSHIEYFRPQNRYPESALDHDNLHASCIRQCNPGAPLHCGHAKGNDFDETSIVSPTSPDCEGQFRYALDGQIIGENEKAAYMQSLLKLDLAFLNGRRAQALEGVFDNDFLESATEEELDRLRQGYAQGRLPDFGHGVARYAAQLLRGTRR